jgi:hypothetical protein
MEDLSNPKEAGRDREVTMQHGFSEHDWLAFLECSVPDESSSLARHLSECPECAQLLSRTRAWESRIIAETQTISERLSLPDKEIEELLNATLGRISRERSLQADSSGRLCLHGAIVLLGRLLEPLLGLRASHKLIDLAIRRSSLSTDLEAQSWPIFIDNLRHSAGSLCGASTERLIGRIGALMAAEVM